MSQSHASSTDSVTAFAPATVANVAVGFDVLGFALEGAGDRVTVTRDPGSVGVRVDPIRGVVTELPTDPDDNTASVAVKSLFAEAGESGGFRVGIDKGIALGSGMGGSAASAVAAVVAANGLLASPLDRSALLSHAVAGERVASGAAHADNAAPCLFGGLVAVVSADPARVVPIPVPEWIRSVVVRPHVRIDTREARAVLPDTVALSTHVGQSKLLAGFLAGCFRDDRELIRRSLRDLVAEPARSGLIPGFERARRAAMDRGAVGFGISGSGPSVFAWVDGDAAADEILHDVRAAFAAAGHDSDGWAGPISTAGARIEAAR